MQIVIDIPQGLKKDFETEQWTALSCMEMKEALMNGIPLPKHHGRLIDISKIEEDRIEKDNPIIYLTIDGNYTEAISLDYLNNLPTVIEAEEVEECQRNS